MKLLHKLSFLIVIMIIAACNNQTASDEVKQLKVVKSYFLDSIAPKVVWEYPANDSSTILVSHFYKNGSLHMKGNIAGGVRDGKWEAWDDQGRILSTGYYKDGFENGMWTVWFPSGQKRYEGLFKDGKRFGKWLFYNNNGVIIKEVEY